MVTPKDNILVIDVDLACGKCDGKIHKVLYRLKTTEDIKSIAYEPKKNRVTVVGTFDPEKLSKKLRCKAGYAIKDIQPPPAKYPVDTRQEAKIHSDEEKHAGDKINIGVNEAKATPEDDDIEATAAPAAAATEPSTTPMCSICYPWTCSDPAAGHPQHLPWVAAPNWSPCGGPSPYCCRGCGSCRGTSVAGSVVGESYFSYEYPSSSCAIM